NQLPILLISFGDSASEVQRFWESVTNPLDKLFIDSENGSEVLGISYQSS
ncbi:hypothetical protein HMPREF9061_01684, partial [Actinomyces sp. oral taxon 181 str. F0379]